MKERHGAKSIKLYSRFMGKCWSSVLIGTILLALVICICEPAFRSVTNFKNILTQSTVTATIAVGMTFVIMTGGIDISVAMNMFMLMSLMHVLQQMGIPVPIVFLLALLVGSLVGVINGFLVCVIGIVPMIATFATMAITRGLAYILIQNKMVIPDASLRFFGLTTFGNTTIPVAFLLVAVMILLGYYLLRFTRFGRYILAVGNSRNAAKESGINVNLICFLAYAFCGFCTAIASMIYIGRLGAIQTDAGYGMEFTVIAAVVLGGTKLSGGRGALWGSIIGCIFLTLIENGLNLLEVNGFFYDVVRGVILCLAVIIEAISVNRKEKELADSRRLRLKSARNT